MCRDKPIAYINGPFSQLLRAPVFGIFISREGGGELVLCWIHRRDSKEREREKVHYGTLVDAVVNVVTLFSNRVRKGGL